MVSDDEEQEGDQKEVLTPRSKKQKKEKEKKLKGTPPDDLRNIQPTEEEIESYLNRPRKKVVRAKETQAQKDARLALGELVNYSSEVFYLDVRVIRRPTAPSGLMIKTMKREVGKLHGTRIMTFCCE